MIRFRRQRGTLTPAVRSDRAAVRARQRAAEWEAHQTARSVLDYQSVNPHRPNEDVPQNRATAPTPGAGRPLDQDLLAFLRQRLRADLSSVRVHDGPAAAAEASHLRARAYTVGDRIVLGAGADHAVLAHELVHVLQQRRSGRTAVQRQDVRGASGIGSKSPTVEFDTVRERAPAEDARALFPYDSASPAGLVDRDLSAILPRLAVTRPLVVDIDGYSSGEGGDSDYNINLSAHRAAAVRAALLPLLPEGSVVRLHAHGATPEFGEARLNRRVGIRVAEAPVRPVPPGARPSYAPKLLPDLQLRLDPLPPLLPFGVLPPLPDVRLTDPAGGRLPRPSQLSVPAQPSGPYASPFTTLPPELRPAPPPPATSVPQLFPWLAPRGTVVDWGSLRNTFGEHGAGAITPEFAEAAEAHTRAWYEKYRAAGIPEERARWLANIGTRSLVGRELANEGRTAADRLDNELRRQGLPTPTTVDVDLLYVLRKLRGEKGGK